MIQLRTENENELLLGLAQCGEIAVIPMQLLHASNRVGDKVLKPSLRNRGIPRPEVNVSGGVIHEVVRSHS